MVLSLCSLQRRGWKNRHIHCAWQYVAANSTGRNCQRIWLLKTHSFTKKLFGANRGMRKRILFVGGVFLPLPLPHREGHLYSSKGWRGHECANTGWTRLCFSRLISLTGLPCSSTTNGVLTTTGTSCLPVREDKSPKPRCW